MLVLLLVGVLVVGWLVYNSPPSPRSNPKLTPPSHSLAQWRLCGRYFRFQALDSSHLVFYTDSRAEASPEATVHTADRSECLLLLHGFPTSSHDWAHLLPELLSRFGRVVALDFLGMGFSDKPLHHTYSIHEQADITESLLRHLNVTRTHVLAHDYGDTVAQELLARQQHGQSDALFIDSICFLNGGLFPAMHRPRPIQSLLRGPLGFVVSKFVSYGIFQHSFCRVFGPRTQPSEQDMADYFYAVRFNEGHRLNHRLISYLSDREQHGNRWVEALQWACQEGKRPLVLINGPSDPVSGAHMADEWERQLPSAELVRLPEHIGHYPQKECPKEVSRAVLHFFK